MVPHSLLFPCLKLSFRVFQTPSSTWFHCASLCPGPSSFQEWHLYCAPPVQSYWLCQVQLMVSPPLPSTLHAFSELVPALREVMYTDCLTQTISQHLACAAT